MRLSSFIWEFVERMRGTHTLLTRAKRYTPFVQTEIFGRSVSLEPILFPFFIKCGRIFHERCMIEIKNSGFAIKCDMLKGKTA